MADQSSQAKRARIAPNLYERGDHYTVIVRIDGKQHVKALRARTRSEAKKEAPTILALLNGKSGVAVGDRNITIGNLVEAFIKREDGPNGTLADNTLLRHKLVLGTHVLPALKASTKAADLTVGDVRRMIDTLKAKGLAGGSVRVCVSALSSVLDCGVRNESLSRNVTRDLLPKDLPSGKRTTEPRYLSATQVESLLKALSVRFRPVAATLFLRRAAHLRGPRAALGGHRLRDEHDSRPRHQDRRVGCNDPTPHPARDHPQGAPARAGENRRAAHRLRRTRVSDVHRQAAVPAQRAACDLEREHSSWSREGRQREGRLSRPASLARGERLLAWTLTRRGVEAPPARKPASHNDRLCGPRGRPRRDAQDEARHSGSGCHVTHDGLRADRQPEKNLVPVYSSAKGC